MVARSYPLEIQLQIWTFALWNPTPTSVHDTRRKGAISKTVKMADDTGVDLNQLSPDQQAALEQYTAVTAQDIKDAVPLLQRSQWNVQVCNDSPLPP